MSKILIVLIAYVGFVFVTSLVMLLPHRLSKKNKESISKFGLIHFTTEEAAQKIINTSLIKANRVYLCAYFFQNGIVSQDAISYNNLESKRNIVEIMNLTNEQLNHLRIRYFDMAVIHFGDFHISESNQVSIQTNPNITLLQTNLRFVRNIALILFLTSAFVLVFVPFYLDYF